MLLHKNAEKETINILLQENKRLKRDNQRIRESLEELDRYQAEYRSLIDEMNCVKNVYISKAEGFDNLEKEYRKELNRVMGKEMLSGK